MTIIIFTILTAICIDEAAIMFIYYIYRYGIKQKRVKSFKNYNDAMEYYNSMDQSKYGFDYEYKHPQHIYKEVYRNILNGFAYSDGFHGFKILNTYNDAYIIFNHYGSSAVEVSYKCIKWLLEKIFMDDFYKLKLTKNGYVNMI